MSDFQPMLATEADLEKVRYPVLVSPKLDGIRCLKIGGKIVSRNMKPIPNKHIREILEATLLDGMDGELLLPDITAPFREVSSAVMSREGSPAFQFACFDWLLDGPEERFDLRLERCAKRFPVGGKIVQVVPHYNVQNREQLDVAHQHWVANGYEGSMLRDPAGRYKFGRSTVKEGLLLKRKDFVDEEATVVGWEPLRENQNSPQTDAFGYAKRSSARAGMVDQQLVGALIVVTRDGAYFTIGSGFTLRERQRMWEERDKLVDRMVTFKHQPPPGGRPEKRRLVFRSSRGSVCRRRDMTLLTLPDSFWSSLAQTIAAIGTVAVLLLGLRSKKDVAKIAVNTEEMKEQGNHRWTLQEEALKALKTELEQSKELVMRLAPGAREAALQEAMRMGQPPVVVAPALVVPPAAAAVPAELAVPPAPASDPGKSTVTVPITVAAPIPITVEVAPRQQPPK